MKELLHVELTRLRWRRAVVVLLLACLLVPAAIWLGTAWSTRPISDDDIAQAERLAQLDAQQPWVQQEIEACEQDPGRYSPETELVDCADLIAPRAENYLYRQPLEVSRVLDDQGVAVVALLAVFVLILGTTFVGHDWNTGSLSNQLLFEPRRRRVWVSKALAVLITGLAVGALVLLAYWGATGLLVAQRDITVTPAEWEDVRHTSVRGVLLVGLAGLLGYALTMLFRSTVATLGVGLGVAAGGSLGLLAMLGDGAVRWLLPTNALAVLSDGYEYYVWTPSCDMAMGGGAEPCLERISAGAGAGYLAVVLVVVVVASIWSFQRRDLP